jgi:hypothetical protein
VHGTIQDCDRSSDEARSLFKFDEDATETNVPRRAALTSSSARAKVTLQKALSYVRVIFSAGALKPYLR